MKARSIFPKVLFFIGMLLLIIILSIGDKMQKKISWEWEKIDENTARAKVIGGWILKHVEAKQVNLIFLADRDHEWVIVAPYNPEADLQKAQSSVRPEDFSR